MSTYTLRVESRFEAAHHLTSYRGEREPIHGHSWRVEVRLEAEELDEEGMAFDFVEIKRNLSELAERFHHRHINEVAPFDRLSPTTERLARWFFEELQGRLPAAPVTEVRVWEGPDCSAAYRPDSP
ncbi:MAG: 6-carboxytetrahydropterin synthase [Acidobacteria bacterium]|nr:6-carboxytetrahydropterin synthase [Acidobacteriota bacterium]